MLKILCADAQLFHPAKTVGYALKLRTVSTLTPGVYHCACPDGYNGTNCEEDINECDPDPCQNSAVCTETSDGIYLNTRRVSL